MTSVSGGFLSDMPSASSSSAAPSPTETVVVINGLTAAPTAAPVHHPLMGPTKGAAAHSSQRSNSSPSSAPSSASTASSSSSTSSASNNSPLFTIVPSLTASSRVVVSSSTAESISSSSSPSGTKGAIVAGSSESPQIIVVSEGDGSLDSTSNGTVGVTPGAAAVNLGVGEAYVQYVDAPTAPRDPLYSHANGQIAYPVYTVGDTTMYAASSTYYTTGNTPVTFSQDIVSSAAGGPILTTGSNTFILQQDVENEPTPIITPSRHSPQTDGGVTYMVSGDGGSTPSGDSGGGIGPPNLDAEAQANIAHATRVSPITVQWLLDNYETAEGVSLPRSTLYNHYLYHCADHKLDPVNSASFGKLIRSVFMGLRTRRLGTRGNSKYHYYGIRVKPNSSLNNLSEDGTLINFRHQGSSAKKSQVLQQAAQDATHHTHQQGRSISSTGVVKNNDSYESHLQVGSEPSPQTVQNQQFLGDVSRALPILPEIVIGSPQSNGVSKQHIENFRSMYQEHCENILEVIYNLQFHLMETVWRRFWGSGNNNNVVVSSDKTNSSEGSEEDEGELASKFPSNVLQNMLRSPPVLEFIKNVDYQFYQNVVKVLIPDVLRSIPPALTQSIRNFAKSLEGWLTNALVTYPTELIEVKLSAVASLAQTLRRYTSLNHLAQAARAVLQNSSQITQMLSDLNRVDFHNVQEQASWVCQCDVSLVERLEEDFKTTLQQQNSLEQWAEWLQTVVDQTLTPQERSADFAKHARQFLLKWSFYSSMVIRDLTLRSAASFGSFHLIRLLYDEYMFYLVEHKVASSLGLTPIAVMSQFLSASKVQNLGQQNLSMNGEDPLIQTIKRPKFEES